MQVLGLMERVSVLCGICSPSEEIDSHPKFYHILRIVYFVVNESLLIVFVLTGGLDQFEAGEIVDFLYTILQVTAVISMSLSFLTIVYERQHIRSTFNGVQNIVDQFAQEPSATVYYSRTNEFCENILKWSLIIQNVSYAVPSLIFLIGETIYYYIRDGWPIYGNTTLGFCAILYLNYVATLVYFTVTVLVPTLFLTMGLFFNTFRTHFGAMFEDMNDLVVKKRSRDNMFRLKWCLIEAINFNNQVKDSFESCQKAMSGCVFCQLIFGIVFMATSNFELEMALKSIDFNIFILLIGVTTSTGTVFLFCSVGVYTTENLARFGDISYESLWYKFPTHLKKYLPMIIADAQRPRVFQGLGIVDLNLITFTKVMKTVTTYYLMFKNVAE